MADWREESSTRVELDEFGEPRFAGDRCGPVIHRTPEELGLPRVVLATPAPARTVLADVSDARIAAVSQRMRAQRERPRVIQGVAVNLPAHAVIGAEMIEGFAAELEAGKSEGKKMRGKHKSAEEKALDEKILADSATMSPTEVAVKYAVTTGRVYDVRYQAKKAWRAVAAAVPAIVANRPRSQKRDLGHPRGAKARAGAIQRVEIDPKRPGTAAPLLRALDKQDARETRIALGFTLDEIARLVDRMTSAQQTEFLAAGLRAALLADGSQRA